MDKKKVKHIGRAFWYSLPIQLVLVQLRKHKAILLFWILLLAAVYGMVGSAFGGAYLFLEPEYLGEENFWSSFIVGSALGGFIFAYMITIYINESYRFHFIALSKHPFYTFAFNNLLIPLLFLSFYLFCYLSFHINSCGGFNWEVVEKLTGLLTGITFVFLISASYFFAKKTLIHYLGHRLQLSIHKQKHPKERWVILGKARESYRSRQLVESYVLFPFKVMKISAENAQKIRDLVHTLSQHHGKLLMLQIVIFLLIAGIGFLEDDPIFQIPMGASILLIFSLMLMMAGALTFWFRRIGLLTFFAMMFFMYMYNRTDFIHEKHQAFGMNYTDEPSSYTPENLEEQTSLANYQTDRLLTIQMLDKWKARLAIRKPKAVFVSASGGGLRSAFWTLRVLQYADSITHGKLKDNTRLMTGASGGMFGLAYFRELQLRQLTGTITDIYALSYTKNIAKDLLNRISFKYFTDVFLPNRLIRIGNKTYDRETGYSFDHQLSLNMPELQNRRLGDYAQWETEGLLPTVVITPSILNQGRKLYISASPVSFLARPSYITEHFTSQGMGVEFSRMFAEQDADSLWMTTALRMNATFPFILPIVQLPSSPPMAVMDAGAMDNYGTPTSVKYLYEFKDWFAKNCEEVIFIQIRDNAREDPISDIASKDHFSQLLSPLDGGYYSMTESRDLANQYLLQFVNEWYKGKFEVISFEYPRETSEEPASLSFHLTAREKRNIYNSIYTDNNRQGFELLQRLYNTNYIVLSSP